jgi:hypothetical protein
MPSKSTTRKAQRDLARGKSPSTAAGEFVREEIEHVRKGRHGARSSRQAIAIGLNQARRAGVPLKPAPGERGRTGARRRRAGTAATSATGRGVARAATVRRGRPAKRGATVTSSTKGRKTKSTGGSRTTGTRRRRAASR